MILDLDGISVHYDIFKHLDALKDTEKPSILFLHGWGVGFDSYLQLINRLQADFTVYAVDMPGFGKSTEPTSIWGVADYAKFVLAFVSKINLSTKKLYVIGHSNGGRILIYLLGALNNSIGAEKAVFLDAAGIKPKRSAAYYAKVYSYKLAKQLLTPLPKLRERLIKSRGSDDYRSASPLMRGVMSKLLNEDMTVHLKSIKVPTLLIWGKDDDSTPYSDALLMEKIIPDAGLVTLSGGHWAPIQQLGTTVKVLESFLK